MYYVILFYPFKSKSCFKQKTNSILGVLCLNQFDWLILDIYSVTSVFWILYDFM